MVNNLKKHKLPKHEILRGKKNFNHVFSKGTIISGHHVYIIYVEEETRKVGFVVSKNVKKSVKRNRYKRLLKEI